MLKLKLSIAFVALLAGNVLAGTIYSNAVNYTEKSKIEDLGHESLAVPHSPAEEDFCIILGDDVGEDLPSFNDGIGEAGNASYAIDLAGLSGAVGPIGVTDIGWDVTIDPIGDSWYSEAQFAFSSDTDPNLIQPIALAPGAADGFANDGMPHTYSSGGLVNLIATVGENIVTTDGILNVELFESFDDVTGSPDANLLAGSSVTIAFTDLLTFGEHTATLKFVPEPASISLMGLAALGLLGLRRKSS